MNHRWNIEAYGIYYCKVAVPFANDTSFRSPNGSQRGSTWLRHVAGAAFEFRAPIEADVT